MKRWIIGLLVVGFAAAGGFAAWRLIPGRQHFYTDAATIKEPAARAILRDVLWEPPVPFSGPINTSDEDYEPRVSSDGATLFFVRGKAGHNADLYVAQRTPNGWDEPQPIVEINSDADELGPCPNREGNALYFYSNRAGGLGGYDLWVTRRGADGTWRTPDNLGPSVNSEFNDYGPAIAFDDRILYFSSNRPQQSDADQPNPNAWAATLREDLYQRTYDIYIAAVTDRGVGQAEPVVALNTAFNEGAPAISSFGDFLYFSSDRPGGVGAFDLYRSRRLRGAHMAAENLGPMVNTASNELDPALSMGGFGLDFSSDRSAASEPSNQEREYNLYHTNSREVFAEMETLERAPIDWAAIWGVVGPNLLWALLALLLLLLMMLLYRGAQNRSLSLLAKCLLASLAAHLLMMLLFNVWEVAASLAGELRRGGAIHVTLGDPVRSDALAMQIHGDLSDVTIDPIEVKASQQAVELERSMTKVQAELPLEARPLETPRSLVAASLQTESIDATVQAIDRQVAVEITPPSPENRVDLSLPPAAAKEAVNEPAVDRQRPSIPTVVRSAAGPAAEFKAESKTELSPPRTSAVPLAPARSLVEQVAAKDADRPATVDVSNQPVVPHTLTAPSVAFLVNMPEASKANEDVHENSADLAWQAATPRSSKQLAVLPALQVAAEETELKPASGVDKPVEIQPLFDGTGLVSDALTDISARTVDQPVPANIGAPRRPDVQLALPSSPTVAPQAPAEAASARLASPMAPLLRAATDFHLPSSGRQSALSTPPPAKPGVFVEGLIGSAMFVPDAGPGVATHAAPTVSIARVVLPKADFDLSVPMEEEPPPNPYPQRTADDRMEMVQRLGGSAETEAAVARALIWLAAHQSTDGRWSADGFDAGCGECGGETKIAADHALTGLGLLCFLGSGHTHTADGPYRDNVHRALFWLVSRQKKDGDLRGEETMYSQGIATIALAEAYAMTGDATLAEPVRRAVNFIYRGRNPQAGGWRYDPGQPGDTSVLGWQIMALKSAARAGLAVPDAAFEHASKWLDRVSRPASRGLYSYQPNEPPTPSMTAEGLFSQQLLGLDAADPRMQESLEFVMRRLPDWESDANTYFWYYASLALFQHQGEPWRRWNQALTRELVEHQRLDGRAAGSWDPADEWSRLGGRVYQTALCTLMLEVYYRYLPMYGPNAGAVAAHADSWAPSDDSIGVIRGVVTDKTTDQPLSAAQVRLVLPDRPAVTARCDSVGRYSLDVPTTPDFFALSASREGFVPQTANVKRAQVEDDGALRVDFSLEPVNRMALATEAAPDVHHLGDNHFDGAINSQFQKRSEGPEFSTTFHLPPERLDDSLERAEVRLLAKGVQRKHRIYVNGRLLERRLDGSPKDGSFGEFIAPFAVGHLVGGVNTLRIVAAPSESDIDDFEFVNIRVYLIPTRTGMPSDAQ